jgi:hypothetical protein
MHLQHEFENYFRHELPAKLNLSPAKQVAFEIIFYHFSDSVKELATKSPREFQSFFDSLKEHIEKTTRWKCPRTHTIAPKIVTDKEGNPNFATRADGKTVYTIYEKNK